MEFAVHMNQQQCCHSLNSQQNLSTVIKVLLGALDEAEPVDITDVALAVGSQQIKSTHGLLRKGNPRQGSSTSHG